MPSLSFSQNLSHLEQKRRINEQQIKRIRAIKRQIMVQEKNVTYNILRNQKRLESSKDSLQSQQGQLVNTKTQLKDLEDSLDVALSDQQKLSSQVGKRLRSMYMGEHTGFLSMVLSTTDLSTLLDRMYYKQRILGQDKKLISAYIAKTRILESQKNRLVNQKDRLSHTIQRIQSFQSQLQEAVVVDKMLVQKLQTNRAAYDAAENQLQQESYTIERQIMSVTRKASPVVVGSTGRFSAPVSAPITSPFGYRVHPIFRTRKFHSGIDFGARRGAPIHAADGGQVITAGWQGGYGKVVIINHGSQGGRNISTLYGHMSAIACSNGQRVSKGQVIGYVGSTGYSTGPHMHWEVRINGRPVNPIGYLH